MASVGPPLPAVLPPAVKKKTLPKELLTLNPDMLLIAKSLRTITHLTIDRSKAADLLSCCYHCPGNIRNKIRDKHFCYSADAWASRGSSRAMHRYMEPLLRGLNKSKTDEEFRQEFTKNCEECDDAGFYKLWRGGKCFCSLECSNMSAAAKRRCQKMMLDGQMAPDYVLHNLHRNSLQQNAETEDALYDDISSEEEEAQFLVNRIYAQLSQASPVAIPTQSDINEHDDSADVAAVKLHASNVNAVEPVFDTRTNSECTVGPMENISISQSVSSVSSVSASPAAIISVKLEPREITTAIPSSSSTNTARFRLKRPCRTDHEIPQLLYCSSVSPPAGNVEASSIAAGTIRPPTDALAIVSNFTEISSITDTVIKRESQILHADVSELAQSTPTNGEQQRYTPSEIERSTNISDDDLEDGFEPLGQINKRIFTAGTPTTSEQPQIVKFSHVSSRRSSVSYDRNIMPVTDCTNNFEAELWQMGTGLSMIPDMEADPSLKKWQTEL